MEVSGKSGYVSPYFLKYGHAMRQALHRAVLRVAIRLAIFIKRGSSVFVPMSRMKRETKGDGIDPVMFRQRNVSIPLLSNAFTGHALRPRPQWVQSCTGLRRAVPVGIFRSVRTAPRPRRIPYRGDRRRPLSPISPMPASRAQCFSERLSFRGFRPLPSPSLLRLQKNQTL